MFAMIVVSFVTEEGRVLFQMNQRSFSVSSGLGTL